MKRYIETKLIEAEKIVRVDGKMQPLDWPVPSGSTVEYGYKVRYADGYESFSPKDVFEQAYMPLEHNKKLKTDAPSISQKMVEDFIAEVHVDTLGEKTTVVRAVLANGFEIVESSSCVSKENYDQNLGKDICMEKIVGKVWYLLGFLLQTAVNGVDLPRMVEAERDLEQEYQEQVSQEQGEWSEALDSSECGCNAAEDSNVNDGCADCGECAPPVDKVLNDFFTGKIGEKVEDLIAEVMAAKVADMPFKILAESDGESYKAEVKGNPVSLISELVSLLAEVIGRCPDKKMQKSMIEAAMEELEEEVEDINKKGEKTK